MPSSRPGQRAHYASRPHANTIGGRVRSHRERREWTQAQLAAALGISKARVSQIERAEHLRSDTLDKIAAVFGCPPGDLLTDGEAKNRHRL